ncbi:PAS domain S-box [Rhizobium leguminosarum bv. trifolii WSM597]|uniref:Blue-light-activated histidine kinase n=1 Tax=Rhizobium leguminosarum bv. trifolii WSM597 TaxID=754764 RepID=I9N2P1_RHILT|nr:PAS domain S-box protein [Rhizobium leguminosarum]EJB02159.1 PAS domain S-box [Rhizobium leguminosarum bv. trifolii WSM597]
MLDHRQLIKRQQLLADFGEFALRSDDLDQVLREACRLVSDAVETRRSKVLEIQGGGEKLRVRAAVGWQPDIVGLELDMDDHTSETYSIRTGEPVITQDVTTEKRFKTPNFMREAGVAALANVPIFLPGNRAYGLLQVDDVEPRDFGEEDTQFLRTYATILGPVIDRLYKVQALQSTTERFALVVENACDYAIFVADPQDRIVDWHKGAQKIFGWTAEEAAGMSGSKLFTLEDRARGEDRKEIETARREGSAPDVRWHLRKDGSRVFLDGSTMCLRNPDGSVRGFLKIGQDVTERHRTEQQLLESEALQRALIAGVPQLVWRARSVGFRIWSSPQWERFTGQRDEDSVGMGWLNAVHPDDRELVTAAWRGAEAKGGLDCEYRIRRASDGEYVWHHSRSLPGSGLGVEWLGTCTDVQELKELQSSQEIMLAELQHRTRNIVAVIRSLLLKTIESSLTLEDFGEAFGNRLGAVARVQSLLAHLGDYDRITFDDLLEAELAAHVSDREKIKLDGPPGIRLRSRAVQTFALALHELATNAVKYGALASPQGCLTIRWRLENGYNGETPALLLEWVETGVENMPAADAPAQGSGYGRELIERALPYQLKAKTTYEMGADGIRCTILAPIAFGPRKE